MRSRPAPTVAARAQRGGHHHQRGRVSGSPSFSARGSNVWEEQGQQERDQGEQSTAGGLKQEGRRAARRAPGVPSPQLAWGSGTAEAAHRLSSQSTPWWSSCLVTHTQSHAPQYTHTQHIHHVCTNTHDMHTRVCTLTCSHTLHTCAHSQTHTEPLSSLPFQEPGGLAETPLHSELGALR